MNNILYDLKKRLQFPRFSILWNNAVKEGKITKFDDEIFLKMSNTIIGCLPVSFYIKYADYLIGSGICCDSSFYMFLALDDAVLVRGNNRISKYEHGKDDNSHEWIEIGNFVYDPSLMLKFEKSIYYSLYGCCNVRKIDKNTYLSEHKHFVDNCVLHDFDEFRPGGKRRLGLGMLIFQIRTLCQAIDDEQFTKDFDDYLSFIEYDVEQIIGEQQRNMQKVLKNK